MAEENPLPVAATRSWTWTETDGVGFWRLESFEAAAPCTAAFSSRLGGVSTERHGTLNLGGQGDAPAAVAENWRRFAAAVGFAAAAVASVHQVHGAQVAEVSAPGSFGDADALATGVPGPVLTVRVADCVPVYLLDPERRRVALAHAGWRGTAAGVATRALDALGGNPQRVLAGIGPSAGPCCYEVGPTVSELFPAWAGRPAATPGHALLDLWEVNRQQLLAAGVRPENVYLAGICTLCDPVRLFSYRRDGRGGGHMAAVLGLKRESVG